MTKFNTEGIEEMGYSVKNFTTEIFDLSVTTDTRTGTEWFELGEVCKCLEIAYPSDTKKRLDAEDLCLISIKILPLGTTQGKVSPQRERTYVNESGLYDVLMGSRANARTRPFKRWVLKEVLPSIRKTGSYSVQGDSNISSSNKDALCILEVNFKASLLFKVPEHIAQTESVKITKERTGIDFSHALLSAPAQSNIKAHEVMLEPRSLGTYTGISAQKANKILASAGYQIKINGAWVATDVAQEGKDYVINHWKTAFKTGYNFKWNLKLFVDLKEELEG